jgi:hypothetical protein
MASCGGLRIRLLALSAQPCALPATTIGSQVKDALAFALDLERASE